MSIKIIQNPNDISQIEGLCSKASAFIPPSRSLGCWSPTFKGPAARTVCPASSCISERSCGTKQFLGQHFAVKIQIVGQKVGNIGISVIRLFHTFPASSNLIFDLIQPRTVFFRVACRRPPPMVWCPLPCF